MKMHLVLFCAAALCCSGMPATKGTAAPAAWNPDDTAPMTNDIASAAAHARAIHCRTPSCKAIIVIHELLDIARYEAGDANGVASLYLGNRPKIAGRRLDRALLDHPSLYGPVCTTGAKLISRLQFTPGVYEIFLPVQLLVNAVDIDLRDHGHCTQDLLASLPKDPISDEIRSNAQSLCVEGIENHDRSKEACDVLIKGLKAED